MSFCTIRTPNFSARSCFPFCTILISSSSRVSSLYLFIFKQQPFQIYKYQMEVINVRFFYNVKFEEKLSPKKRRIITTFEVLIYDLEYLLYFTLAILIYLMPYLPYHLFKIFLRPHVKFQTKITSCIQIWILVFNEEFMLK